MAFDDIPEDRCESFECDDCGGNIVGDSLGNYECDNCSRSYSLTRQIYNPVGMCADNV